MLCSICKKNTAVIFTNKIDGDKNEVEGLCYKCAQDKGINPLDVLAKQANLSQEEIENMTNQFENIFSNMSDDLNVDDIDPENVSQDGGIPIGSFISNIFGGNKSESSSDSTAKKV